ncbi:hypothetical protein GL267_003055 [Acidithiobacillus ferrianus]|uniref:Transglycosylase SLT domain-containing protein n=2 Tax=Acidithiobacillus ferrianus TaxID=2678518 RepID=A0A845UP71_9PROT|nr:hypothetical protein [Acidithiobacillus ferrianus]NDU43348.1 hypothetical protein [Acidithiobacillus ferrianus]
MHYQTEPPSAYIRCAPKPARKVLYGIAETETAGTGDPLQLVDTSTLKVYRPSNPGKALAIIHALEKQGHNVAIGAFGLKSSNFPGWKITDMDALNACFSANFAAGLLKKNKGLAWGQGCRGAQARNLALAAYTTGRLSLGNGGGAYVQTVDYFSQQYERSKS